MQQVYKKYADGKEQGVVATNAIEHMNPGDDAYFKGVFEQAAGDDEPFIKAAALEKIADLSYIKQAIAQEAVVDERFGNPASSFLEKRGPELYKVDPRFVDELARSAMDMFVRVAAIGLTSARAVLQTYAELSEEETDEHRYPFGSEEAIQADKRLTYKEAAVKRLAQLEE